MKNKITNLILLFTLIGVILIFYYFVSPQMPKVSRISETKDKVNELLVVQEKIASLRTGLESSFDSISDEDRKKMDTMLPEQIDTVSVILEVEKIVKASNLELKSIDISQPDEQELTGQNQNARSLSMSIQVSGLYSDYINFLQTIENNLRIIDVVAISFAANPFVEGESKESYNFRTTLQTYWLPNNI